MRDCPECQTPMTKSRRTFADVDVCPKCGGTFLDAGEGISTFGPEAEAKFLVEDGRARRVGASKRSCPAGHGAMSSFAVKARDGEIELYFCEECGGFFFDAGEGEALAAIDAAPPSTFVQPPAVSTHDAAIEEARQKGSSFFARFVTDLVTTKRKRRTMF